LKKRKEERGKRMCIVEQKCVLASASKRLHLAAKEVSRHYVFYILNLIATRLDQKTRLSTALACLETNIPQSLWIGNMAAKR